MFGRVSRGFSRVSERLGELGIVREILGVFLSVMSILETFMINLGDQFGLLQRVSERLGNRLPIPALFKISAIFRNKLSLEKSLVITIEIR